jgi:hypothetical protein
MSDFIEKGDKFFGVITKYSLLGGGILSLVNAFVYSGTDMEKLAWVCSSLFALSGFAQILKLEYQIKENDEDNISG